MKLSRRRYLETTAATIGGVGLAGCSNPLGGGGGGPEYEREQQSEMVLTLDAFPGGWQRDDDFNDNFDATFLNSDTTIVVLIGVEVFEDVAEAKDRMESARMGVSDPNDYNVGDDSFWAVRSDGFAGTLFRDSNAVGQSGAVRESGSELVPDQARSQEYAGALYDRWQTL